MRFARPKPRLVVPQPRRRPPTPTKLLAACGAVFAAIVTAGLALPIAPPQHAPANGTRIVRVIDGDTVVIAGGERVRILNIDTAEMPPRSRCAAEARLALAARARLSQLVQSSDEVVLSSAGRDRDQYGRQLRLIRLDGVDVGEQLVREGLAKRWRGRRAQWC